MRMERQYENYLTLEIPNRYKLQDVYDILEKQYKAVEISKNDAERIYGRVNLGFENMSKWYLVSDVDVLKSLPTEIEMVRFPSDTKKVKVVFLGSYTGEFLDYGYASYSLKIQAHLDVFAGISPIDISNQNREFRRYLKNLDIAGYFAKTYEEMYRKYQSLDMPHRFKLQDIYAIFENEYKAVEVSKYHEELTGGLTDENADFDIKNIRKCYHVANKNLLDILYSELEKKSNLELESRGEMVVFLGTYSGEFLDYYTIMGGSNKMDAVLSIFTGINPEDISLDNPKFLRYLSELETAGFLD